MRSRRPKETTRFNSLADALAAFENEHFPLPGLSTERTKAAFLEQLIDSIHRVEYFERIEQRPLDPRRADPSSNLFCPIRAAIFHRRAGNFDEACWLAFLAIHFNPHKYYGWQPLQALYSSLGTPPGWTWVNVSNRTRDFEDWLRQNYSEIQKVFPGGCFGNHRKYETINPNSNSGTDKVIQTYIDIVGANRGHRNFLHQEGGGADLTPEQRFANLYRRLDRVHRFGRTAKFDYLCMLAKLGLADIKPDRPYIPEATGPLRGAKLAFTGSFDTNIPKTQLEKKAMNLADALAVGMQEIEDCLCNWQKRPDEYKPFRN